ncbi:MAG: SdrD B-like domain-containing protein [Anaerolineales bacterium]|jgi:hypothetical protein
MKKLLTLTVMTLAIILAGCDKGNPVAPDANLPTPADPDAQVSAFFTGRVWIDENGDNLWEEVEPPVAGAKVELVPEKGNETLAQETTTGSDGSYRLGGIVGHDYFLIFTPPAEARQMPFAIKGAGPDAIDSDVDAGGQTDWFTLDESFDRTLSAGLSSPEALAASRTTTVDDASGDCRLPGSDETQPCPGDILRCHITPPYESEPVRFSCDFGTIEDFTELDLYAALNLDGDDATGKSEGTRPGVDAELFLNGMEGQVYLNRYDPSGAFSGSERLPAEIVELVRTMNEGGNNSQIEITLRPADEFTLKLLPESKVGFVVFDYPPAGGKLYDETGMVAGAFAPTN